MNKIKSPILHIISGLGVGGAERMLSQTVSGLSCRGHRQIVISLRGDGKFASQVRSCGAELLCVDLLDFKKLLSNNILIIKLILSHKPRIICGWMYHGNLYATFLFYLLLMPFRGCRLIWGIRCSNMDTERSGFIVRWSKFFSRCPESVVYNSYAGLEFHRKIGFSEKDSRVIHNGIDTKTFSPDALSLPKCLIHDRHTTDQPTIFLVARVDPMKNHSWVPRLAKIFDKINFVLVGDGTQSFKEASCSSLSNVIALGVRDDLPVLLARGDIILSTSVFGEGFPNAVAEGMCCGLVPIVSDVGDTRNLVGETGYVYDANNFDGLVRAINAFLNLSLRERREMGADARARVVELYSYDKMIDEFERLYDGESAE